MAGELDLLVIQEDTASRDQDTTPLEDKMIIEMTDTREVTLAMKTEETEEIEMIAETEEIAIGPETDSINNSTMATASQALEGAVGRL